jgi:hypothetical protein
MSFNDEEDPSHVQPIPHSLDEDARRDQAKRRIADENLTSLEKAVASAETWCFESMQADASVEYWKERAEAAERLVGHLQGDQS